jgi:flagellar motor protein MotB
MTENIFTPRTDAHPEPQGAPTLRRNLGLPKGVLQKNLKTFVYLGAVLLVIVAALFSSSGKKTPAQQASAKGQPPQPMLQDNTDNNVQELKNQLQAERQKEQQATMAAAAMGDSALASATPQQRAAAAAYGPPGLAVPCIPGQPCTSIALGVIAGASEITQGGGTITTSGSQAFTSGTAGSVSQSATTILDRFIQIPPTITIREGHRVKVYFTQDLLLPAYSNHTIPQTY